MSLDLDGKSGHAHNTVAVLAAAVGTITAATFNSGDFDLAGKLTLQVDTTAGDADLNTLPTSMLDGGGSQALVDGVQLRVVKISADSNNLTFIDPITAIAYNFVDRRGEYIELHIDTSTGTPRWVL
jgi:hypothetical protein